MKKVVDLARRRVRNKRTSLRKRPNAPRKRLSGMIRALVVAADPALQAKAALTLLSLGIEVTFASDSKEALAFVQSSAAAHSPWSMPDIAVVAADRLDGLGSDLVGALRSSHFVGPVVLLGGASPSAAAPRDPHRATGTAEIASSVEGLRTVVERVLTSPGFDRARQPARER